MPNDTHSGYIAIIGRPNVGKSTLLNALIGKKVAITCHKPQTTRHQILGIHTEGELQMIFVDTPGIHLGSKSAINQMMNKTATQAVKDVDAVLFVVDATRWTQEDENALTKVRNVKCPVFLVINKIDKLLDKKQLLPQMEGYKKLYDFTNMIPLSAQKQDNLDAIWQVLKPLMPEGPHYFPDDQITDRQETFMVSEIIREKLMARLQQEVPYQLTVEVEQFKREEGILHISAVIWVETEGQKGIVIGKQGQMLKGVGQKARLELQYRFDQKVMLKLWVNVKSGWSDNTKALQQFGYE